MGCGKDKKNKKGKEEKIEVHNPRVDQFQALCMMMPIVGKFTWRGRNEGKEGDMGFKNKAPHRSAMGYQSQRCKEKTIWTVISRRELSGKLGPRGEARAT